MSPKWSSNHLDFSFFLLIAAITLLYFLAVFGVKINNIKSTPMASYMEYFYLLYYFYLLFIVNI